MKNSFKKRFSKISKKRKFTIIFSSCFILVFVSFLVLGYSMYRERIANLISLTINRPTFSVSLNNQSANTAGTGTIYQKYGVGYYLSSDNTNQMTTTTNGITIPVKDNYTFGGYYTLTNGGGTQYIDDTGKLTNSASTTNFSDNNGVLYAKWTENNYTVTVNVTNGTPATQSDSVVPGNTATFTVTPNTDYGNGTVSCTNSQTATLSGNTLTTGVITNNTVCTVSYTLLPTYTVEVKIPTFWYDAVVGGDERNTGYANPSSATVRSGNTLNVTTYNWFGNYYPDYVRCTNSQSASVSGNNLVIGPVTNNTTCTVYPGCTSWSGYTRDTTTITQGFSCSGYGCSNCNYYSYCCGFSAPSFSRVTGEWTLNGTWYQGNNKANKYCMMQGSGTVGTSCTISGENYQQYYSVTSQSCQNSYTHRYYWTYTDHYTRCD